HRRVHEGVLRADADIGSLGPRGASRGAARPPGAGALGRPVLLGPVRGARRMELKSSATKPDTPNRGRRRWLLHRPALEGLLSALDTDVARAAQQYERLRERLIIYFSG